MNQNWLIAIWNLEKKLPWKCNHFIFIEDAFENVCTVLLICSSSSELILKWLWHLNYSFKSLCLIKCCLIGAWIPVLSTILKISIFYSWLYVKQICCRYLFPLNSFNLIDSIQLLSCSGCQGNMQMRLSIGFTLASLIWVDFIWMWLACVKGLRSNHSHLALFNVKVTLCFLVYSPPHILELICMKVRGGGGGGLNGHIIQQLQNQVPVDLILVMKAPYNLWGIEQI